MKQPTENILKQDNNTETRTILFTHIARNGRSFCMEIGPNTQLPFYSVRIDPRDPPIRYEIHPQDPNEDDMLGAMINFGAFDGLNRTEKDTILQNFGLLNLFNEIYRRKDNS